MLNKEEYYTKQSQIREQYAKDIAPDFRGKYGYKRSIPKQSYKVSIRSVGWKNIDAYLAAKKRINSDKQLMEFNIDGKYYSISFSPLSFIIPDRNNYERLMIYLIPDQNRSFLRIYPENEKYETNLNDEINVNLFILGIKNNKQYFFKQKNVSGNFNEIVLEEGTAEQIKSELNDITFRTYRKSIAETIDNQKAIIIHKKRQEKNSKKIRLRHRIRPVIFPCI